MLPLSLAHRLITAHGPAVDAWRALHPQSSVGCALDDVERARGLPVPSARANVEENGATCDGVLNTWRWSKADYKALKSGRHVPAVDMSVEDPRAKRLDYIFVAGACEQWKVVEAGVGMMERHPTLNMSLSDHFSVEVTIERIKPGASDQSKGQSEAEEYLPIETYNSILQITEEYMQRERSQRRYRLWHFGIQLAISIACLVAVWWSPHNFVSFLLMLLSSLGLAAGVVDGLIGGLFMSWEIRCLKEFRWEMENIRRLSTAEFHGIISK
jgi:sphingomyelin phosphodiesterase 2